MRVTNYMYKVAKITQAVCMAIMFLLCCMADNANIWLVLAMVIDFIPFYIAKMAIEVWEDEHFYPLERANNGKVKSNY